MRGNVPGPDAVRAGKGNDAGLGRIALAALAMLAALALGSCGSGGSTSGSSGSAPAPSSTRSESPSADACADPTRAAGIYYAADVLGYGPRLYREFATVATCADPITESVDHMLHEPPVDADYTSLWEPDTQVLSVSVSGDTAEVDLTDFPSLGAAFEGAAVQQLVWTVTAADPSVSNVRILVDGQVPDSGHYDWSDPIPRANSLQTLANVWILSPTQGATVISPVQVRVYGTGYEGNVPIRVLQGGTEVASAFLTTMMGGFAEASTQFTLPPGDYTINAYNDSGRDPGLTLWDTKDFTVV